ncbi:hypothetical protein Ga0061079_103189 [Apibacter mensalis]|uniref:Bacteriophage CI repressor helix-turn-helix domain-containing protein n=1 Tax=Apibacter mensalis TaxID=1586267 RepID=A0A0X3APS8_9FLAO|nr:hypothetical protein [Apibacter mensalis]CVK15878.1 hypothetical protein Ga0061079_103189 [Apibacter mensalis]
MKAINRIKQYIDYKGLNNSSFEKKNNLSNGYIAIQLKRKSDLGEGILNKILDNCLDINPEWLLTGKGNMLKSHNDKKLYKFEEPQVEYSAEKNKDTEIISILKDTIHALKESLELKDYKINKLEQENEALKKEINSLNIVKDITVAKPLETISKINK